MIENFGLEKKITARLVLVLAILVLLMFLISIQIAYFNRIPNNYHEYSFSKDIPSHNHNYTDPESVYEVFYEEDDWEVTNTTDSTLRAERILYDNNYIKVFIEITADETLELGIVRRFTFETQGPPLHPRAVPSPDLWEPQKEQTRESVLEIMTLLDLNIPEDEIEVRWMSFISVAERPGAGLNLLSYFLLYLIATSLSIISKNPLIPSVKDKDIGIFITGMWYFGIFILFFYLRSVTFRLYHFGYQNRFAISIGLFALVLLMSSFLVNYYVNVKRNIITTEGVI